MPVPKSKRRRSFLDFSFCLVFLATFRYIPALRRAKPISSLRTLLPSGTATPGCAAFVAQVARQQFGGRPEAFALRFASAPTISRIPAFTIRHGCRARRHALPPAHPLLADPCEDFPGRPIRGSRSD